jgi:hypothetical protein
MPNMSTVANGHKRCRFDSSRRCWHDSCDFVNDLGNVCLCPLHRNPDGFCMPRKVVLVSDSVRVVDSNRVRATLYVRS